MPSYVLQVKSIKLDRMNVQVHKKNIKQIPLGIYTSYISSKNWTKIGHKRISIERNTCTEI